MRFRYSSFGQKALQSSGIGELMEDMGEAMNSRPDLLMLGGGNPAHIPAVEDIFRKSMQEILKQPGAFCRIYMLIPSGQGRHNLWRFHHDMICTN